MMQNAASLFMLALLFSLLCIGLSSSVPPEKQSFQGPRALGIQPHQANAPRLQPSPGKSNRKLEQSLAAMQAKISDLEDRVSDLQQRIDQDLARANSQDEQTFELIPADKVRVNYQLSPESRDPRSRGSNFKFRRDLRGQGSITGAVDPVWDNESVSVVSDMFDFPEFGNTAANTIGCRSVVCQITLLDDSPDSFTRFQLMFPLESADFLPRMASYQDANWDGLSQSVLYLAKPGVRFTYLVRE